MSKFGSHILVCVIVVMAFYVRFWGSGSETLSGDEVSMGLAAQGVIEHGVPAIEQFGEEYYRPATTSELIPYLVAISLKVFSFDETGIRFHSVICGTLAVVVLYLLAYSMFGMRTALLAALLLAFSAPAIELSQWARYPATLQLATLVTCYLLYLAVCAKSQSSTLLYMLFCTLFFLISFLAWQGVAFLAPALLFSFLIFKWKKISKLEYVVLVILAVIVAGVVLLLMKRRSVITAPFLTIGSGAHLISLKAMWEYSVFDLFYYFKNFFFAPTIWLVSIPAFCSPLLQVKLRQVAMLLSCIFIPILLMTLLLEVRGFRYVYYLLPYVILLASFVITSFADKLLRITERLACDMVITKTLYKQSVFVFVAIYIAASNPLVMYYRPFSWEGAASWPQLSTFLYGNNEPVVEVIKKNYIAGDKVISISPHQDYFYLGKNPEYFIEGHLQLPLRVSLTKQSAVHALTGSKLLYSKNDIDKLLLENRRVWFVCHKMFARNLVGREFLTYMESSMKKVGESYGFEVYLWSH